VPALALLLGACASGGNTGSGTGSSGGTSSGSSGGLNTTPTPGVNYDTAEYRANWGLPAINAAAAYSDGATGQGITVGVIDTGLDITHPEFVNHYDPASTDIADPTQTVNDVDGHGTLVAGIVAAKKNDVGMHGVAFDANLLAVRADRTGTCASSGGCSFYDNDIAAGIDYAVAHGARIINLSLGGTDPATSTLQTAMSNAVQKGVVIVIAAGNIKSSDPAGTGSDPDPLAQYAHDPRANGQVIIAGAADHSLQAASFSYKAGTYKDVYLLAPGYAIYTTYNDGGYTSMYGGTSLATPHIVGAAALLMQAFPNLTAQQVVQLLLSTATDEGTVGPDATNGMGFLNIAAAFAPQGTLSVSMSPQTTSGTSTSSQTVALTASLMSLGPAFGDALSRGTGGFDAVALDSYSRAYTVDLGSRVLHRSRDGLWWRRNLISDFSTAWVHRRLSASTSVEALMFNIDQDAPVWRRMGQDRLRNGLVEDRGRVTSHFRLGKIARWTLTAGDLGEQVVSDHADPGASFLTGLANSAPYLSLVQRGTGMLQDLGISKNLSLLTTVEFGKRYSRIGQKNISTTAISTGVRFAKRTWAITPKAGVVSEHGGILGGSSIGLFALDSTATTRFLALDVDWRLSDTWSLHGDGRAGWTSVNGAEGLWSGFSTISTSAFRLFAAGDGVFEAGDRLTLGVGQPLRVESGRANLVLPTSYNYGTESFGYASQALSLSPSGREMDFEAVYAVPLGNGWSARANLVRREDAGHIAGVTDTAGALQFHVSW